MEDMRFVSMVNGERVEHHVIATRKDESTGKEYMVYTDNEKDEFDKLKVYYALYEINDNRMKVSKIVDDEDKRIALDLLKDTIMELDDMEL